MALRGTFGAIGPYWISYGDRLLLICNWQPVRVPPPVRTFACQIIWPMAEVGHSSGWYDVYEPKGWKLIGLL